MRSLGHTQAEAAEAAGVDQSTICRALKGKGRRKGAARGRICNYALGASDHDAGDGVSRVAEAFERIWDRTNAHANAVVNVIGSLEGLVPKGRGDP
jgi:hypothetical protein